MADDTPTQPGTGAPELEARLAEIDAEADAAFSKSSQGSLARRAIRARVYRDALRAALTQEAALREALARCGVMLVGQPFVVTSAYDDATRQFGYQVSRLVNPDAKTHNYKPIPGTFVLTVADALLLVPASPAAEPGKDMI